MNSSEQIKALIEIIGEEEYAKVNAKIPAILKQSSDVDFSDILLQKDESQILQFYQNLINNNQQWSPIKLCGSVIILTSHVHELLKKLVSVAEKNEKIIKIVKDFDLHNLILFCSVRYDITDDYFLQMIKLKHFRNMVGHNFNGVLQINLRETIPIITSGHLLIIVLTNLIKKY